MELCSPRHATAIRNKTVNESTSGVNDCRIELTSQASIAARHDPLNRLSDLSLLRGVRSSTLERRFGELFKCPAPGWQFNMSQEEAEHLYNKSEEVRSLHWFISHSWRARRWRKYLAICVTLRGKPAVICAVGASLCWILFESMFEMPTFHMHSVAIGQFNRGCVYVVFILVYFLVLLRFVTWGNVSDPYMFLDKCCIHQLDPIRKAQGIAKLGGFLRNSERMLVLWSTDYCERLWCMYELASFLSVNGMSRIDFVDLYHAGIAPFAMSVQVCLFGCFHIFSGLPVLLWIFLSIFAFPILLVWSRAVRFYASLRQQLNTFSLDSAQCFCCTVNHTLQETEAKIPCDRVFVKDNVAKWFKELCIDDESDGVKAFERIIHEQLAINAQKFAKPISMHAVYPFFLFIACIGAEDAFLNKGQRFLLFARTNLACPVVVSFICCALLCVTRVSSLGGGGLMHRWPRTWDCANAMLSMCGLLAGHQVSEQICMTLMKIDNAYLASLALLLVWLAFMLVSTSLAGIPI